jgi:hypothetical protein
VTMGQELTRLDSACLVRQSQGVDWKRLGDHVIARRVELGYPHRRDLAKATGVSDRTLAKLEVYNEPVGLNTLASIENVLQWTPGTAERILNGDDPVDPASASAGVDIEATRDALFGRAVRKIMDLPISEEEKRGLIDTYRELLDRSIPPPPPREAKSRRAAG